MTRSKRNASPRRPEPAPADDLDLLGCLAVFALLGLLVTLGAAVWTFAR